MLLADVYTQDLNPVAGSRFWSAVISTFFAALPVLVLFYLLVPKRWLASKAGAVGAIVAIVVAWLVFGMPVHMACMSFVHGAGFGLLPVGWTVLTAMLLYNITVETGQFAIIRRSVASLSNDARIQAILIGFAFGAFLEGAAGGGTPVAICGAMLVGLGFDPIRAAVLCLIANTSPVAYGGLGTPIITLASVTDLPGDRLSVMAGHQLPLLSCIIPIYMVKCMCSWKKTFEVWPALVVGGGSFAIFQFLFATMHVYIPLVLWPMTDIGGGIFSLIVTAVFLKFWKPKQEWHFDHNVTSSVSGSGQGTGDAHAAEAQSAVANLLGDSKTGEKEPPLTARAVIKAWTPFALMSVFLMIFGFVRQAEGKGPLLIFDAGSITLQEATADAPAKQIHLRFQTMYEIPIPWLDKQVERATRLQKQDAKEPQREGAVFKFVWLTAPGTPVLFAAIVSIFLLRMNRQQLVRVVKKTIHQMRVPIPTIACMLGLSYVTRYAGMDATLGIAFAETGMLYPFFAAILGWLGVFLTGTDAGSNALFGSLQKITATEVHKAGAFAHSGLTLDQAQVLICTANSTGGVMGKMIDAQSICVATAATNRIGREADIFKAVIWHSIILASIVGLMTLIQAYVPPFTRMVP